MTRLHAFLIHLGVSLMIFLGLAWLIVYQWYPGLFLDTDGGWRGLRIILAVDLVLGPLLTLIVFKPNKPGLRTDLTLIGALQMLCLLAGTWIVHSERPIAVVYVEGRFTSMSADDYVLAQGKRLPDLTDYPGPSPKWVKVQLPEDSDQRAELRARTIRTGQTLNTQVNTYVPFSALDPDFLSEAQNLSEIVANPAWAKRLDNWLNTHNQDIENLALFTFSTRYVFGYLVYHRKTLTQVGLITHLDD